MKLSFSPIIMDGSLSVSKLGDILTINGEDFDFSVVPEGATLPRTAIFSDYVDGDVTRKNGELSVVLRLPITTEASDVLAFPDSIENAPDGVVNIPTGEVPADE